MIDTLENHLQNTSFAVTCDLADRRITRVTNNDGNDVRRFVHNQQGTLTEVVLPNGSYVVDDESRWQFQDLYGNCSPTKMEYLQVDHFGNISFDNPSIGARVTLTADEHTIIQFWHRSSWRASARWTRVERTDEGLVSRVVDLGGKVLREFEYNDGLLVKATNMDTTNWHLDADESTWIFTEANGVTASYSKLDLKVDENGNVGYTVGDRAIVELFDGTAMIGPSLDWKDHWIVTSPAVSKR